MATFNLNTFKTLKFNKLKRLQNFQISNYQDLQLTECQINFNLSQINLRSFFYCCFIGFYDFNILEKLSKVYLVAYTDVIFKHG